MVRKVCASACTQKIKIKTRQQVTEAAITNMESHEPLKLHQRQTDGEVTFMPAIHSLADCSNWATFEAECLADQLFSDILYVQQCPLYETM